MRTIKKNGRLLHLLPLPSASEENQHCPNCRFQFDPVKFRRAQYVACKHFTCLECVLSSNGGCNQCPNGDQNDDAKCNRKKLGVLSPPTVNPEEEENTPKLVTENGTCSSTPSPAKPAILSLVKKPGKIVGEQNKKSGDESKIQSSRMEVIKLEPINGDFEEMMETNGKKEGEKVINSSTATLLVDEPYSGSDCDVVFVKRKDATSRLSEAYKLYPFTCDICQWQFDTERELLCHRLTHTSPQSQPEIMDVSNINGNCGSPLTKPTNRIRKLKAYSPRRVSPRRMDNGCASSVTSTTVTLELPSGETKELHPCPHCGQTFSTKLYLNCHMSMYHSRIRPHYCDRCASSFQTVEEFENHKKTHHSHRDRRYKCTKCDSKYSQKYRLDQHVRLMHPTTANGSKVAKGTPRKSTNRSLIAKNRMLKETKKLDITQRDFKCDICSHSFYQKSHKLSHMLNKHRIRMRLTSEDLARKKELGEDGKYCPECQSEFDEDTQADHKMVAYSMCGHLCCLQCAVRDADLGCGQCTTETAPKTRCPSASPSPLKKKLVMEIAERRRSKRMVVKPLKLRDLLDLKQVDELIGKDDSEEEDHAVGEKRQKRRASDEPSRTNRGRPKGSLTKRKITANQKAIPEKEEKSLRRTSGEAEPSTPETPGRGRGRPKSSRTKRRISTCEEKDLKQEEESSKNVKNETPEPESPRKGPGRPLGSLSKFKKQNGLKETIRVLPSRAKLGRRKAALPRRESQEKTGKLRVYNSPKNGLNDEWKCRFCNKMFVKKKLLSEHMQKKHRDILPVHCDICQWSFHSRRDRDRHMIRRHTASGRNKHTILKTVSKKRRFKCEKCEIVYNFEGHLERHMREQHPRKIRGPYKKRIKLQE